ncbi:hypothetical protein [Rhizobium sp. ST-5]|uniref:hypothetical protein n=1 Tax=Rhizobium sp. ST-5 TaxID=3132822 RepID=UPI003CE963C7
MNDANLAANYTKAYDNRIGFGKKPALVLVDFVQAYFEPQSRLYAGVDEALASALRVRAAARSKGMSVIFTGVVLHPSGLDGAFSSKRPSHSPVSLPAIRSAPGRRGVSRIPMNS